MRFLALFLVCISLACLPTGKQPVGRHLLVDRSLTGVYLTASETAGDASHVLVAGPSEPGTGLPPFWSQADLYTIAYDADPATAQNLASLTPIGHDALLETRGPTLPRLSTDSRGRLLYSKAAATPGSSAVVVERFDFLTGQATELAEVKFANRHAGFQLSTGRTRLFVDGPPERRLFDLDGAAELRLGLSNEVFPDGDPLFVGEDYYYEACGVAPAAPGNAPEAGPCHVARSRSGLPPEVLYSSPHRLFVAAALGTDRAPRLLVANVIDAGTIDWMLLDTQTLATQALPLENAKLRFMSSSGSGHWLLFAETLSEPGPTTPGTCRLLLVDWTTGRRASIDPAGIGQPILCSSEWRPGREELWIDLEEGAVDQPARRTMVWKPGASPDASDSSFAVPKATRQSWSPDRQWSLFTRDGRYWFSQNDRFISSKNLWGTSLGSADAPSAPPVPVAPNGTALFDVWEMQDGRLLVGVGISLDARQDIYVLDPNAGSLRFLASKGHVVALGKSRALALLNWFQPGFCGDLTLIDLETGAQALLAEDVYAVAVDPGVTAHETVDADRLPPGVRVAFLTRYRMESPDDGLWVASLP